MINKLCIINDNPSIQYTTYFDSSVLCPLNSQLLSEISNNNYYRKPTICTDMVLPQDIAQLLPPFAMLFDFCECFHTFHHHRKPVLMNVFSEITLPTFLQAFYILTSLIFYNTARYFGQLVSRGVIFQIIVETRHQIILELCCI